MTSTTSTEEPQTGYDNPVVIRCKGCGAPVHFDIVKQNFRCPTCGAEMPCAEGLEGCRSWHKSQQMKVMEAAKASKEQLYQCEGCGAQVIVHAHDTLGHCQFCGGTLVGRGWAGSDLLPAIIIPFYLTAQEAQEQLEQWCKQHSHRKEAKLLKPGLENLEGYYLPYELVKGTAIATSTWASSTRTYHCRCYLDGTAVNTSSQTDNQLLDGVEPFDFAAARPFDFHMLGGCNAKLQDVDEQKFRERVAIEVNEDVARTLKAQFRTSRAEVDTHPQELLVLPILLPLYLLSYNGIQAAVNGQTGRVAVTRRKVRMNYSFYWESLAITIVLTGIVDALYYYLNLGDELWGVTWTGGALIAFIIFMLYFALRKPAPYPPILRGENVKAQRDGHRKLTIERNQGEKPAVEAVFYEKLRSGLTPVNIRFYSIGRIA